MLLSHKKREAFTSLFILLSAVVLLCSSLSLNVSESVLAGQVNSALLVDFHYLNDYLVAYGNNILNLLNTAVLKLGNVNHAVLAGSNFNKCAEVHDTNYLAL